MVTSPIIWDWGTRQCLHLLLEPLGGAGGRGGGDISRQLRMGDEAVTTSIARWGCQLRMVERQWLYLSLSGAEGLGGVDISHHLRMRDEAVVTSLAKWGWGTGRW